MNLTIIGTSHIAKQSIKEIQTHIKANMPDIIAVELDVGRAKSLFEQKKSSLSLSLIPIIGLKGFLFAAIGKIVQQKLGNAVGVSPGEDMKTAIIEAKKHKLKIALIDQPIQITLRNFSKALTWKERFRFLGDIITGIFTKNKGLKKYGLDNFDLRKVPADKAIKTMMKYLEDRYPSIYKVLVADRNRYMVRQLVGLMCKHPDKKILAVVGAGHKSGMEKLLLKIDVVR